MKAFLIKTLLILFIIISIAYILDYAISKGLSNMKDYRFQCWREIKDGNINADIIINGNSRALSHILPSTIDSAFNCKTYNLGFGGYPFNMQYFKYGFYLSHNRKPKVIIQNVDYFTLIDAFKIGHEREQIFPFMHDIYLRKHLEDYGFDKFEINLPLVRYFGYQQIIKNGLFEFLSIKHYNNKISRQGFVSYDGDWDPTELNKIKSLKFSKDSFSVSLFEKYLNELKRDSIKVIMVNTPMFYKAQHKIINRDEMNLFFKKIAQKYQINYLDFSNDTICADSSKFVVAMHLNYAGAQLFTQKLISELKKTLPPDKNIVFE